LEAYGGGDLAEDVTGALQDLTDGSTITWTGGLRFAVLICDAPGHENVFHKNDTMYNNFQGSRPARLSPQDLMAKLSEKNIHLFLASCNEPATRMMFNQLRKASSAVEASAGSSNSKVTEVDKLVNSEPPKFHFIFCLDESGSMSGDPWRGLEAAYNGLLQDRHATQALQDLCTVIQFDSECRVTVRNEPVDQYPRLAEQKGGGTCFIKPITEASSHMSSVRADYKPVFVMMSDGEPWDDDATMRRTCSILTSMHSSRSDAKFYFMHFGGGGGLGKLNQLASAVGTTATSRVSAQDLIEGFADVASSADAVAKMAKNFGERIANEVAAQVVQNCL
jgi:uncharacterized protein YegL